MGGHIPEQFIDQLLGRIDIVDIVDARVALKKSGQDYSACCPFHNEKTPSFTVSQKKQFYHCFGCGAHGSAIGFLMEHDGYSFPEAIEELAEQAGLEIPREPSALHSQTNDSDLYELLSQTSRWYQQQLRSHAQKQTALDYLKQRGLNGEIAATFAIGYAPPGWDNLLHSVGTDKIPLLRRAGLISEPDSGKRYDRFRERIMFPIRDRRGRTIGFGGRILDDGSPKYLNSPETEVFHKGRELYGLYEARKANRKLAHLLVVEGYMDVVALTQFGISCSVATLGTATTAAQLELMFRSAPLVIFCFDGDQAGQKAAWKALQTALPLLREGRQVSFLILPQGEDPDTLVRRIGAEDFSTQLNQATPLSQFFFQQLQQQTGLDSAEARARLAELARPLITQIPADMLQQTLWTELSRLTGIKTDLLTVQPAAKQPAQRTRPSQQSRSRRSALRTAVTLLLQHPQAAQTLSGEHAWPQLQMPGIEILSRLLEILRITPNLTTGALIEHWRDQPEYDFLSQMASASIDVPAAGVEAELNGALQRLTQEQQQREVADLIERSKHSVLNAEQKERLQILLQRQNDA
ncbi:MAG: DNA primase [gamma proteobacterium symbiont of Bathyaustriella thionipta]|nr:DNA primase [gamma proteobacterium symbiont of Bathyaustriella thionipta]